MSRLQVFLLCGLLSFYAGFTLMWAWCELGPKPVRIILPPAPPFPPQIVQIVTKPRQQEAVDFLWRSQYEMVCEPPAIMWVEGDKLNCSNQMGWLVDDVNNTGQPGCVSGQFDAAHWAILLAWPEGLLSFASTALAHELAHARTFRDTGEISYSHAGYDFAPRGRVERANVALSRAGL